MSQNKWNKKNLIKEIIESSKFYCGKCGTLTSLHAGIDYYYFGNGINDLYVTIEALKDREKQKNALIAQNSAHVNTFSSNQTLTFKPTFQHQNVVGTTYSDYFAKDKIVWKCEKCFNVNINSPIDEKPKSIVPNPIDFSKIIKEIEKIKTKNVGLANLIEEFYKAKSLEFNSSAALIIRKILMYICVEQEIGNAGSNFTEYVDALKSSDLLGKNWKPKVDLLRKIGNNEAHKLETATKVELENATAVLENLLQNIYTDTN